KTKKIILMIQKEVAQRICEKEKMSILSLSVQFYAMPKILFYVSKGSFFPEPKVDSAVIEITPNKEILTDSEKFFKVIKAGFSSPRKLLASNLAENLDMNKENIKEILRKFEINEKSRAEDLTIQDWINLSNLETQSPSKVRR
ncbi:16S rRNA (adenine(1518)-N(6)/adenine(1519)-N(6))-dimethyltransferase RsmA, partial [Candidatus Azambacteria bacterium]|nr:16S rRNA (adenine(1518)-N(6)/adenine(1519)-N(6))-dimethyltransferase RsmA [Candidatus Azambacteria bacterium]